MLMTSGDPGLCWLHGNRPLSKIDTLWKDKECISNSNLFNSALSLRLTSLETTHLHDYHHHDSGRGPWSEIKSSGAECGVQLQIGPN